MILLLHSTETADGTGATLARNMPLAGTEPHAIYEPCTDTEYVLHAPHEAAKALRNEKGGVETNRRDVDGVPGPDVYQVEIVCYAAGVAGRPDEWYANLRRYLQRKCTELSIPYVFPLRFAAGANDAAYVRLSFEQWYDPALTGIIGHCHVPENSHWDPGPLDLSRLQIPSVLTVLEAAMALEPTTQVVVSGNNYNLIDVLGWTLEGINALRAAATTGSTAPLQITPAMLADELARRLSS